MLKAKLQLFQVFGYYLFSQNYRVLIYANNKKLFLETGLYFYGLVIPVVAEFKYL